VAKISVGGVVFDEAWLDSGGVRLHVVIGGAGRALVLLHGWPGYWKDWEKVMPLLASDFKVVVPDLRGFGLSDRPEDYNEYTLDRYSQDVKNLLDLLDVEKAFLSGFDVGSSVASYFAVKNEERVGGLVLISPSYPGLGKRRLEEKHARENWYQFFHLTNLAEQLVGYNRETVKIYLTYFFRHWSYRPAFTERDIEEYVDVFSRGLAGGFNWYKARVKTRYVDWLGRPVTAPTLILWPDKDPIFPLEWSDNVKTYFPNSKLEVIRDCGHYVPREAPDEYIANVKQFLSSDEF